MSETTVTPKAHDGTQANGVVKMPATNGVALAGETARATFYDETVPGDNDPPPFNDEPSVPPVCPPQEDGPAQESEAPEAESLRLIAKQNQTVRAAKEKWEDAKEEAATKKKHYEAAQDDLSNLIRQETEEMPLFEASAKPANAAHQIAQDEPGHPDPAEDLSWRDEPLGNILAGLPPSIGQALYDADLATVGQLADFTAQPNKRLTDIPGIGPAKAEKVEAALEAFWARRKKAADAQEAPPAEAVAQSNVEEEVDG